jgi:hypothetical protein
MAFTATHHHELSLTLLESGVLFVDHVQPALPAYDLAIVAAFLDGCPYFHFLRFMPGGLTRLAMTILICNGR